MTARTVLGRIHGNAIEFDEELGLAEGQLVEVAVRAIPSNSTVGSGAALLRTEGALADDSSWDEIMDDVYRARKVDRMERADVP